MKKFLILVITTLLISSCSSSTQESSLGFVPGCDEIKLLDTADKSIVMPCLDGVGSFNFHQLKGPIVINVWGSWCEGCKEEMPYFVDLYETASFQSGQVQLLGINVEESSKVDAIEFIEQSGMSWPHLEDLDGISKSIFGPGVPVTWFINKEGKNMGTKIGAYTNKKQLFEQVEKAFGIKL
jgi:cytochrome c biogenesis protein CcmG, thiol:disulfide interchange protein DsbE